MSKDRRPLAERVAFGAPYPDPVPKSALLLEALLKQRRPDSGAGDGSRSDAADAVFAQAVDVVDELLRSGSPAALLKPDDGEAELLADNLVRALILRLVAANESFKEDEGISSFDISAELDKFDRAYDLVKQFQQTARARASRPFDALLCDVDGVLWTWPSAAPGTLSAMRPVLDENVVALLELAREVIPVALVSNATDRLATDLTDLGLADFVDTLVNTSRIGAAKPDPRVYAYAAEQVGVPPERCLFVDDSARNVEAARAAGMQAVHFRELADLDDALRPFFTSMR